jgi:glycosyltransferase involved in cell wall biosynthesis
VLLPTAEEDEAIDLDVLAGYFAKPAGYLFLTPEEEALVSQRAGRTLAPAATIGIGLDPAPSAPSPAVVDAAGISGPYVLYLGRVDRNKGCQTLLDYFTGYVEDGGTGTLVLAGPQKLQVPIHPAIRALGYVSPELRDALLAHATTLVVPSPYESLSIVLLEAWNHGIPALVNARCKVLEGQVRRANGGLHYRTAREFNEALRFLMGNPAAGHEFGQLGLAYGEREYRWPTVLSRVERLLADVASRRG